MIYGGFFIGLCAACITAFTFSLNGHSESNLAYSIWIGLATAALYCGHRVIGLHKVPLTDTTPRFAIIRRYQKHIWFYFGIWIFLTLLLFFDFASVSLAAWLIPGGSIGLGYILPFLTGGRRLRDLGWTKILMIGWSWGWLTAFIPMWYFAHEPLAMSVIAGIERMLFIIAITIPFEIRDLQVDRAIGVVTLPEKFGRKNTTRITAVLLLIILLLSALLSFQYFNIPYFASMTILCLLTWWIVRKSWDTGDDYFFGGLTDGLMIFALLLYQVFQIWL